MKVNLLKVSRLEGLTDGVFAIAMTILALDLRIPRGISVDNLSAVLLSDISQKLFVYCVSFIILGTLWVAMNFQIGLLDRVNRPYLWCNVIYLMIVCVVPFSASLVTAFPNETSSILFYAINLICASMGQLLISECAHVCQLNRDIYNPDIRFAVIRRIFVAPAFYILAIILAYWNTKIAFIILLVPTAIYMIPGKVDTYDGK